MKLLRLTIVAALLMCVTVAANEPGGDVSPVNTANAAHFVPHSFYLYADACFLSPVIGRFDAGGIEIIRHGDNYWAYAKIGDSTGWLNLRHSPALCALDGFFAPLGRNISVFYKNLDTGFTYVHNPERGFFAASLSKSTHALYTFKLAERGYINMHEIHTYSSADEWGGTGVLRFGPFGVPLTTRDLLGLSIRESDNAAFRMLVRLTRDAPFSYRDFVEEIGAETRNIRDVFSQNTNARDKGRFMYETFRYIEGDGRYAHYFRHDLLNTALTSHPHFTRWYGSNGMGCSGWGTDVNVEMLRADYPIARKYGWSGGAFHDAGIIYAPSPYILVVLSNMERGAHDLFEEISWFVQDFNNRTFVAPVPLDAPVKGPALYDGTSVRVAGRPGGFRLTIPFFAEYEASIRQRIIEKNIYKGCGR